MINPKPYLNAIAATLYISAIGILFSNGDSLFGQQDTILAPIAMLSLFTLSAAVMGYLFLYQPLIIFLDGNKKKAVNFFLQTVAIFALITVFIFILMVIGVFK